jgi:hypothetical protein
VKAARRGQALRAPLRRSPRVSHPTPRTLVLAVHDGPSLPHTEKITSRPVNEERRMQNETTQRGREQDEAVSTSVSNPRRVRI